MLSRARALLLSTVLPLLGCPTDAQTADARADLRADLPALDARRDQRVVDPRHQARVFALNPVATPTPALVELTGLAGDAAGALTSAAGKDGVRRLAVYACVDEGATLSAPGLGVQRICTLRQRASSETNGSFIYEDWTAATQGTFDVADRHAEVSLYYHASKIYDFITSAEVGLGDVMAARHLVGGKPVPLTLIANYQLPVSSTQTALAPANMAALLMRESGQLGMWSVQGLTGVSGDVLMFGQGLKADFAYDGETVYHELGHWISSSTAQLSHVVTIDSYGLDATANAVAEGISDTFAFLVSRRARLFDYLDTIGGPGFLRDLELIFKAPQDLIGMEVSDGMILGSATWAALQQLKKDGVAEPRFARVLVRALQALSVWQARVSFARFGDAFLKALADDGVPAAPVEAVRQIFQARGLYEAVRARDISAFDGTDGRRHVIFTGGVVAMPWNVFPVLDGTAISPAYVQCYVDAKAGASTLTLSAVLRLTPGQTVTDLAYKLFVRAGSPILYTRTGSGTAVTVAVDKTLEPALTKIQTPSGEATLATWTLLVTPGARTYLQPVNYGQASGALRELKVVLGP
jgi:hypothetical protein